MIIHFLSVIPFKMFLYIIIIFLLFYIYFRNSYWKKRGIKEGQNYPFFGSFLKVILGLEGKNDVYTRIYKSFPDEKYVGIYEYNRPVLVLKDINLIKDILINDFSFFVDHPHWIFNRGSFLYYSTFNLKGDLWRALRYKMAPIFSAGRVKNIIKRIDKIFDAPKENEVVDMKKFLAQSSADAIAAFYGSKIQNKNDFYTLSKILGHVDIPRYYKLLILEHFPLLGRILNMNIVPKQYDIEFRNIVANLTQINTEFTTLMRQIASKKIEMDSKDFDSTGVKEGKFSFDPTEELLMGQAAQFLNAGLDTTSNTMSFLAWDLCENPSKKNLAREEILKTIKKHGDLSYNTLQDLKYLEACIKESSRMHSVFSFMFREATRNYTFSDGFTIEKGTKIVIPSQCIQMDTMYYTEPDKFLPERWLENYNYKCTWLPFGEGPRQCLGMRFAIKVIQLVFAQILSKYDIEFDEKTHNRNMETYRYAIFGEINNDFYAKFVKKDD